MMFYFFVCVFSFNNFEGLYLVFLKNLFILIGG